MVWRYGKVASLIQPGRKGNNTKAMRPPRQQTPLGVWIAVAVLAGLVQWPLVSALKQAAIGKAEVIAPRTRRPVRLTVTRRPVRKTKKAEVKKEQPKGKVVTVRAPEKAVPAPKKTKYLSEHNTRVKKQKKARRNRRSRKRRMGAAAPKKVSKVQSPQSKSTAESTSPRKTEQQKVARKAPERPNKKRGDLAQRSELARANSSRALVPTLDKQSAIANLQAVTGGSASDDWLPKVKAEGKETLLNSRRFRHWDFFNTVKSRVRRHWRPAYVYRRKDPTGKIYGIKDRLTVVRVTLNNSGKVLRLTTVKNSGVDFLDAEARKALRKAGPFTNPPNGLVNKHGAVVFQFGFLFEISNSKYKFFRIPM